MKKCQCYSLAKLDVCGNKAKFKYLSHSQTGKELGTRYVCGTHKKYMESNFKNQIKNMESIK